MAEEEAQHVPRAAPSSRDITGNAASRGTRAEQILNVDVVSLVGRIYELENEIKEMYRPDERMPLWGKTLQARIEVIEKLRKEIRDEFLVDQARAKKEAALAAAGASTIITAKKQESLRSPMEEAERASAESASTRLTITGKKA